MPIVEALCLNDAFDSTACWYYEKGRTYEIDTESEIAHMKVRPMSSGKMNKDGEIVAATITRPSLPVFQFDRANPLGTAGAGRMSDYTCKQCGATKDNLGRPFTLNSLGTHTNKVHKPETEEDNEEVVVVKDQRGKKQGKTFTCQHPGCGEVLPHLYALKVHKKTHAKVEAEVIPA